MIAVTFALPAEGRDLATRLSRRRTRYVGSLSIVSGRINAKEVEILHTGVGTARAEHRVREYLSAASPEYLIAAGFAGATRRGRQIGEIILGENYSDAGVLAQAEQALAGVKAERGRIFTSSEVIDRPATREDLWQREGVAAVEMESSVIAAVAREKQIPMLSLRSVSDTPEHPFPLPPKILFDVERQRTVFRRLIGHLVANPGALPRLIRFSRQVRKARRALADALVLVIQGDVNRLG